MRILKFVLVLVAFGMLILATNAHAKLEGVFSDWAVHSKTVSGDTICYALAKPKSKTPSSVDHGDIYFMVADWKSGAAKEQPSLITGYMLKAQIPPSARIGRAKIPMFADKNEAFVESGADEKKLVRSMRKGSTMRVDAVSARGTQISYEFSLRGITAALGKVRSVCK
ncbi:MAG: invasion associated locus B family protein [Robiginitomaculum sp.]|nr:invasion associated locus B family protein [Robiginitomaculum sp.]